MSTIETAEIIAALESWSGTAKLSAQELRLASDRLVIALDRDHTLNHVWLVLSVLGRGLPSEAEVREAHRTLLNEGAEALLTQLGRQPALKKVAHRQVELLHDAVIVDVRHTAETDLATGIQRVARETSKRWAQSHDITLVTWTADGLAMRRLLPAERATALDGAAPVHG
ncbi:MAG: hypothetical protein H7288_25225, partial [Kineosporiaceae bacterium]|nr:hypothetical protein [Aeromicrobium sp.]